jgi:D-alanine-D-alanine ligase
MGKKKLGVVCGGFTSEFEISLQSGKTVFDNLDPSIWDVFLITITPTDWSAIDKNGAQYSIAKGDFSLQTAKKNIHLEILFNVIHGAPGENGQLAALWELLNIPFTSCDSYTSGLTYNKRDCLSVLREINVPTAKHYSIDKDDIIDPDAIEKTVGLPCFVKANRAGSSFGVFKVKEKTELKPAIKKAFQEDSQIIIESALEGREVSVGVALFNGEIQALPITEIITENEFFDYAAKYEGKSKEITPAQIPSEWKEKTEKWAKEIYRKLGLKGVVRSEFIFVKGEPHLLEINTVPGLTENSIIPQQVRVMGMELSEFFNLLLLEVLNKN